MHPTSAETHEGKHARTHAQIGLIAHANVLASKRRQEIQMICQAHAHKVNPNIGVGRYTGTHTYTSRCLHKRTPAPKYPGEHAPGWGADAARGWRENARMHATIGKETAGLVRHR
eukprot:45655-Pleurochrysis_carterae.AAC.1